MTTKNKWRIYCITESTFTEGLVTDGDPAPTVCFNNPAHTVNPNSVVQKESFTTISSGNLSIVKALEGLGNIGDAKLSVEGSILVGEGITELTGAQGYDISEVNYLSVNEKTQPSDPAAAHHSFYLDSADSKLKSIDSSGNITVYNPQTTKGDLAVHDGTGTTRLPAGTDGYILSSDSAEGTGLKWVVNDAESTTGSNVGTAGVGPFKQLTGNDLEFKNINTGSSKVTITDDVANNEIDIDIVEANIVHQNLSGAGTNTHAQIDSHISSTANPHSVTIDQITPTTTKGDILVEDGANVTRLGVGSNNQVLIADSAQSSGLKWGNAGSNQIIYDAIVDASGNGDYTSVYDAFNAGHVSVYVKIGTYNETNYIDIPSFGLLQGECGTATVINFTANKSIRIDGSARRITTGTISITVNTTTVTGTGTTFTSLQAGDYIQLDNIYYKIDSITNNTSLELSSAFKGNTISGAAFIGQSMKMCVNINNIKITGTTEYGIYVNQCYNINISHCTIDDCGSNAAYSSLYFYRSTESHVTNTIVENGAGKGLIVETCTFIVTEFCTFKNIEEHCLEINDSYLSAITESFITHSNSMGINVMNGSGSMLIKNCIISYCNNRGINSEPGTTGTTVNSCQVKYCTTAAIDFDGTNDIISDCTVNNNSGDGMYGGVNVVATCNRFENNTGHGLNFDNDDYCVLNSNYICGNGGNGINIASNGTVNGNFIKNNGTYGVNIISSKTNTTITSNRITGHTTGININTGCTNMIVKSNNCEGNTNDVIDNGTDTNVVNALEVSIDKITPTTTKGDLLVENGANVTRLPVGTNNQILVADSAEATGLKWIANTGGANDCLVKVSANDTTPGELTNKIVVTTRTGLTKSDLNDAGDEDLQIDLTNQIKAPDGTYTVPTYSFDADSNTGMYREGSGDLAFAQNGTCTLEIGTDNRVFMSNMVPNYETLVTTNQTFTNKKYVDDEITSAIAAHDGTNTHAQIDSHIASVANPHSVDISDVTPLTTKGDLMVRNASATTRLAVGTNDYVLTADSAEATGLKWAAAAGGGGGGQDLYEAVVATSGGDYTSIKAAFDAGKKSVFVKRGTYTETGDITIPAGGLLIAEAPGAVVCNFSGAYSIIVDGSAREISTGTISVSHASSTVTGSGTTFTTMNADDYIELDGVYYKISSIETTTSLTLDSGFQGVTISGMSFRALSMSVGVEISNLVIANSSSYGVEINQGFRVNLTNVLIKNCGAASLDEAVSIYKSSEIALENTIIENSPHHGLILDYCTKINVNSGIFKNNEEDGAYITNTTGVILDACYFMHNDVNGINIINSSTRINITDSVLLGNDGKGINTDAGTGSVVMDSCTIEGNGTDGIDFDGDQNIINDCIIKDNGSHGVQAGNYGIIQGNRIVNNGGSGYNGANDDCCVISGNWVKDNTTCGISAGINCTVTSNLVISNTNEGIRVDSGQHNVVITGNRVLSNATGILIDAGADNTVCRSNNIESNTTNITDNSTTTNSKNQIEVSIDQVTPTTTKGDLLVEDGSNVIRLGVGTNGQVLVADSAEASGVKWDTNTGGANDCLVKVSSNDTTADELIDKIVAATRTGLTISEVNDAGDEDLQIDLTNQIKAPDGTYTVPTYSFDADSNTGMYREGSGDLAFAQNGTCTLEIGTDNRVFMSNMVPNYETLVTTNQTFTNKKYVDDEITSAIAAHDGTNTHAQIDSHIASTSNPHSVDISDVTPLTTKGDIMVRNASATTRLAVGTNDYVLTADSAEATGLKWAAVAGGGGGTAMLAIIKDIKSSGTNGGDFNSGAWRQRDLNTLTGNASSRVSLATNQFTLQAGKYYLKGQAPAAEIENHQTRVYNVTDSSVECYGTSISTASNSGWAESTSPFDCYIDISSAKTFKVEHRCNRTELGDGMGSAAGWGDEVYTSVVIKVLE